MQIVRKKSAPHPFANVLRNLTGLTPVHPPIFARILGGNLINSWEGAEIAVKILVTRKVGGICHFQMGGSKILH
jgi:hypothetical protein